MPSQLEPSSRHGRLENSGKGRSAAYTTATLMKSFHRSNLTIFHESNRPASDKPKSSTSLTKAQYCAVHTPGATYDLQPTRDKYFKFFSATLREQTIPATRIIDGEITETQDTMFIVEVYENYGAKDHKAPPDRRLMTFFKFRDDQVQIWVEFFREVSRLKIYKFYPTSGPKSEKEDVIWTFEFPTTADVFGAQAKQYLAKLRYACERMSLTMLAYSNVDRSTVVPAAQANFHTMSSGSKTKAMLALPGEMDEVQEPANANPAAPQYMRIIMDGETSRDDDWVFTGAWNEPGLVAMIDKFGVGWDRDGRPRPTAVKKKRQSKKKNIDEQQRAQERFEIQHETTVEPTQSYSRKRPLPLDDSSEVGTPEVQ